MQLVTHSGQFHADDVFSTAILLILFPHASLTRTRDNAAFKPSPNKIIFDVGNQYNPKDQIFDHHQTGGAGIRENKTPYASVGLIWKHYGRQVIQQFQGGKNHTLAVFENLDNNLFCGIDAEDNGALITESYLAEPKSSRICLKSLGSAISNLQDNASPDAEYKSFELGVAFAKQVITQQIINYIKQEAAQEILAELNKEKKPILIMNEFLPWQEFAVSNPNILFAIYPSNNAWYCQAAPTKPMGFEIRKPLPTAWAGLNAESLAQITGVKTATFCHNNLFICGARTRADIIKLAALACNKT